ncbi:alpha-mannosidase [Cellulomonas triticagri]|uniref:Alpha-mannosidase n=1 Tax=Cellulomonas triticagri TaxID=2483352 RepID=A0A3M2JKM6_9CELL|nr:alpha-mannosidase [Cellulomonas triticagri]RMI12711.1 alpha-mannosidase [Cellulomonas triticagri]
MHDHFASTPERLERVQRERVLPRVHTTLAPLAVEAWRVGEDGEPVSVAHALGLGSDAGRAAPRYEPFAVGSPWGPAWSTTWFRVRGTVPADAPEVVELVLDLGWFPHSVGGHCEAMVVTPAGEVVKALHPRNTWVRLRGPGALPGLVAADGSVDLYVEAAANPLLLGLPPFVVTEHGEVGADEPFDEFVLRRADVCGFDPEVWDLSLDLEVAGGLAAETSPDDPRHWRLLRAVERALDAYDGTDPRTAAAARALLAPELALPARAGAHQVTAVGHAHIDSAWLWPLRETRRKLGRTVSNALAVLDTVPDAVYTMTSAQHFRWLEERFPGLFARVREHAAQGRFVPVGGMWVEADGVLPTGESLVRQMVLGKRYFAETFGHDAQEVWLPDSFGYSGALPQLARRAGFRWFFTQKISWNDTTTFPHHTFWWEGIDGTRVLTHFPPSDTYAAEVTAAELTRSVAGFRDKAIASHSLMAYGYGDGGGGPTREMTARAQRFADLDGAPRVRMRTPTEFFVDAEADLERVTAEDPRLAPSWHGELYLELHRGTLTTQVAMKQRNRRSEGLLRTAEYLSTAATLATGAAYPAEALAEAWQEVLLLQFHDILPGTSISWVHREARESYDRVEALLADLVAKAGAALAGAGAATVASGRLVADPGSAATPVLPAPHGASPTGTATQEADGSVVLADEHLRLRTDPAGQVVSLVDLATGREIAVPGEPIGALHLFRDEPVRWDAWDVDRHALRHPVPLTDVRDLRLLDGPQPGFVVERAFGDSSVRLTTTLRDGRVDVACEVDWQESEHLLKVALPVAVRAPELRCETQYGWVGRPVHPNTAGDDAMFEAAMHRYVHVADTGYGVGVVNDAMSGVDARTTTGGTAVRLSLLRAPRFPDPRADRGQHVFRWSVLPGADLAATVRAAAALTAPVLPDLPVVDPLVALEPVAGTAVVDWVKVADDGSGDVVVRVYEPVGGRATAVLRPGPLLASDARVRETDLLERDLAPDDPMPRGLVLPDPAADPGAAQPAAGARLDLGPFQVLTLRLTPGRPAPVDRRTTQEEVR